MKRTKVHSLGPIAGIICAFAAGPARAQFTPTQPRLPTPVPLAPWRQVAKLGPETLQLGSFYTTPGSQPYYLQDDYVCGFYGVFMHLMTWGPRPGRDLLFHVWQSQETLFGRLHVYLRGDRSGSRSLLIKITYLPQDTESFTVDTGGTLTVKTWLAPDGNSLSSSPRVVTTQTYAAKQGIAGRDEMILSFTHQIGPNLMSSQTSPHADFDLFGKPSSYVMSGKIISIELSKR